VRAKRGVGQVAAQRVVLLPGGPAAGMSRCAIFDGASPLAAPEQLWPINTEISAAPMASSRGTAAAPVSG
jgi:hypothetical protein